jgi:signal transduction histidine kinase
VRFPRVFRTSTIRFAALYTALFCLSIALLLGFLYNGTVRAIDREIDAALESELAGLRDVHRRLGLAGLVDVVRERSADPATSDNAYLLLAPHALPLAGNLVQWPAADPRPDGTLQFEVEGSDEDAVQGRLFRARTMTLPDGTRVLVAHDVHRRAQIQQLISTALAWGLAVTLVLGIAGGVVASRALLRRLVVIAETSERIVGGQLSERIPLSPADDELDRLATQLNRMLDRIEQLMVGMRTISDSIAHDLRAPLARLRGAIETALPGPADPTRYRDALQNALFETDRVLSVFNAVMSIAQARSGALREQMETLDVAATVIEATELYEPVCEERGLTLEVVAPTAVPVLGHRQLLAQAFANLLDNAAKFTPRGGIVRLVVERRGDQAVATVTDTGPGIVPAERERVLAPFDRGDHCAGVPGSGLGLSLVAAVARLHDATLVLDDNAPGLRVTLSMPLAHPSAGGLRAQQRSPEKR